jgi:hypothetical protein
VTSLDVRNPATAAGGPSAPEPSPRADLVAAGVAAVTCVLLGAPVGLLWATVAPKVVVEVSGTAVRLSSDASTFIAGDGWFLGVVFVAGLLTGLVAWAVGRRHGPGVVAGLTVGGLIGAYVAARTGELVDEGSARAAVEAGRMGGLELSLVLRSTEAVVGWPVGALLGFLAPFALWPDRRH